MLVLLLVSAVNVPVHAKIKFEAGVTYSSASLLKKVCKVGASAAAIALAGYGAWKLIQHVRYAKPEQFAGKSLSDRYFALVESALKQYEPMYKIIAENQTEDGVLESTLYSLALQKYQDAHIDRYITNLQSTLFQIYDLMGELLEVARPAGKHCCAQTEIALKQALIPLEDLLMVLEHHKNYFILFEQESSLMRTYERDLYAVEIYQNNETYLRELLQQSMDLRSAKNHRLNQHDNYLQQIEHDVQILKNDMQLLAYNYENRLHAAGDLLRKLEVIYATVEVLANR